MIAMAWAHHCKIYRDKFKEGVPKWLDEIKVHNRLQIVKVASKLNWRLPQELISDVVIDSTHVKRRTRK